MTVAVFVTMVQYPAYADLLEWRPVYWFGVVAVGVMFILGLVATMLKHRTAGLALLAAGVTLGITCIQAAGTDRVYRNLSTYHHMVVMEENRLPGDAVMAYPHQPYSFAWYTWGMPVVVLPPASADDDVPTKESLVAELDKHRRTFCILQKRSMVDELRTKVKWPITLLSDKRDRYTFIMTTPPQEEPKHDTR